MQASTPTGPVPRPILSERQERAIHAAAVKLVVDAAAGRLPELEDPAVAGAAELPLTGAFVTLKRQGRLRACCGWLGPSIPLGEALRQSAVATATQDPRVPKISVTELEHLTLDVSLLYGAQPVAARGVERISRIEVGRHGLQVARGSARGLLLPAVAVENSLGAERFLDHVCVKAGLPPTAWREDDTELSTFETYVIDGPVDLAAIHVEASQGPPVVGAAEVARLADLCGRNIADLLQGTMPTSYLLDIWDGDVAGVAMSVDVPGGQQPIRLSHISLRPEIPLQATLFRLSEAAAAALREQGFEVCAPGGVRVRLSVLQDPAMHGTLARPDLQGLNPAQRAAMVVERARSAWAWDPGRPAEELLRLVAEEANVREPEAAAVFSLRVVSTEEREVVANVPEPRAGPALRPPAVAGAFYPADPGALSRLVDEILSGEAPRPRKWRAVMVPHAGLQYSGRVAASVLRRVEIPPTVIVIGPKHTPLGVEWAVAPHEEWSLPGISVKSDVALAGQLAQAIDGLELDALAHQREHGVEVELPFIARLAPEARVVGIAIGGGSLQRCRRFAQGLARVLRERRTPTLLVISSDMNHYASDAENRRLDDLALKAMEGLDPAGLLETCRTCHISMCGVLPAVIVMETLRALDGLKRCERVAYATTADVSGDTSRVVGYAGMLLD